MSTVTDTTKVIEVKVDYSPEYRFRLWVALVDDIELLGFGYRAYHSHIMRSFDHWEQVGYQFYHPKGYNLDLTQLQPDDLYGFLGKSTTDPIAGPSRNIRVQKFAVLDAFLKAKKPQTARSFEDDGVLETLATVGRMYFCQHNTPDPPNRDSFHSPSTSQFISGIYTWNNVKLNLDNDRKSMTSWIISPAFNRPYFHVKKIFFPIETECIEAISNGGENSAEIDFGYNKSRIITYEGLGFFSDNFSLACIMRNSLNYAPFFTRLFLGPDLEEFAKTGGSRGLVEDYYDLDLYHDNKNIKNRFYVYRNYSNINGVVRRISREKQLSAHFDSFIVKYCGNLYKEISNGLE